VNNRLFTITIGGVVVWEWWTSNQTVAEGEYRSRATDVDNEHSAHFGKEIILKEGRVILMSYKPRPKIPLKLTEREQNMMAELCLRMRSFVHMTADSGLIPADVGEAVQDWAVRYGVKQQELDQLYDKFHRSGANT
jgi:hypothetical protein